MTYRPTIGGTLNPAVRSGTTAKNNGRYNGNGREWETPPEVFGPLDAEFRFTLDPCATAENAKCSRYFTELDNGLARSWAGEVVFMNPPYGREVYAWTAKARAEAAAGAVVVGLLPASTDLAWWHDDVVAAGAEVRYIRGRVRFLTGGPYRASGFFASVIVIWRPLPVPSRIGNWLRSSRGAVPGPAAGQDPPVRFMRSAFGGFGGEVGGGEGEGPAVLVAGAGVGCGDGLAVEVADGAAAPPAGVGGADVAGVEPERGVGVGGEEVLDGAEPGGNAVAAVVAQRGGSPLGPHGAAECGVAGLGAVAGSEVPDHAITVAVVRRRDWVAAWAIVLGAIFLPLIMALGVVAVVEIWRAVAG